MYLLFYVHICISQMDVLAVAFFIYILYLYYVCVTNLAP